MLTERFTFLCTKDDRLTIIRLAKIIQRPQGDMMRFLLHEANNALVLSQNLDESAIGPATQIIERISKKIKENQP